MTIPRVVITGIGPFASAGIGKEAVWQSIIQGKTNIVMEDYFIAGQKIDHAFLHKIENFDISNFGINKRILDNIKSWKQEDVVDLYYLMAAVKLALDDSQLTINDDNNKNVGLVLTHENPGMEQFFTKMIDNFLEIKQKTPSIEGKEFFDRFFTSIIERSGFETQTFMFLHHIAKAFDIHGFSLFTNNACASGLFALETASLLIKGGRNKVVVVAAADYPRIYKAVWFKKMDMYPEDGKIKAFDKNANGFVLGDGGVGFVLEDLDHALQRNAHIYAEYKGGGYLMEGWKIFVPDITGDTYRKAIEEALRQSRMNPQDIDLICAHGVGTRLYDRYEAKAITDVFGLYPSKPLITSFKPYLGHNLGGSALIESAIALLAMEKNLVPPLLNTTVIDNVCKINPVMKTKPALLRCVLKICSAFAGFNAASVFEKFET